MDYKRLEKSLLGNLKDLRDSLEEIKQRQLYRSTHPSFESYCRDKGYDSKLEQLEQYAKKMGINLSQSGYKNPLL